MTWFKVYECFFKSMKCLPFIAKLFVWLLKSKSFCKHEYFNRKCHSIWQFDVILYCKDTL